MTPMREIVIEQGWRERIQELASHRKDSWPLLALAGAVVLVTVMLTGRSAPARVAPPASMPSAAPSVSAAPVETGPMVLVHVAGAVREPGLYEFPQGARVADAIETAGGPTVRADLDLLNLAEPLVDGTKVEVLKAGEAPITTSAPVAADAPAPGTLIPLNTANQAMLETIPGVGPVTATAILTYRDEVGSFTALEQLLEVDGIGPATFDNIRAYVTL
jgi:competence protein ComEA